MIINKFTLKYNVAIILQTNFPIYRSLIDKNFSTGRKEYVNTYNVSNCPTIKNLISTQKYQFFLN